MTKSFIISSCGFSLRASITGKRDVATALLATPEWGMLIPNLTIALEPSHTELADINIECTAKPLFNYDPNSKRIVTDSTHIITVVATFSYLLEQVRQEHKMFMLHGNLISNGKNSIALIGGISGIGKTTLSAHMQTAGWKWYSDDKFIVNARAECVGVMHFPLADEKTKKAVGSQKLDVYDTRATLTHLIIPIVTDESELTVHYYDNDKASWHIYEELSRDIRLSNGLLDMFGPLPSFDTLTASQYRAKYSKVFAEKLPMIYLRGNRSAIRGFLQEL